MDSESIFQVNSHGRLRSYDVLAWGEIQLACPSRSGHTGVQGGIMPLYSLLRRWADMLVIVAFIKFTLHAKDVIKRRHQKTSSKDVIKRRHQKTSSKDVIKRRHQKMITQL